MLFLVKTESDYEDYLDFYTNTYPDGNESKDILYPPERYRRSKIDQNQTTWEDFELLYQQDPVAALEILFKHDGINKYTVEHLQNCIDFNYISLEGLFKIHMENRYLKIGQILCKWHITKDMVKERKQLT